MSTVNSHQPLTIHQYHYTAAPHDALTNYLFWIQKNLKDAGIGGEIFASRITDIKNDLVKPFNKAKMWNCDLLLVHHSQGNPDLDALLQVEVPKAVIYNNITPPEFFRHDPFVAKLCRLGQKQLKRLKKESVMGFATSLYNLEGLKQAGFTRVEKLPLLEVSDHGVVDSKTFIKNQPVNLLFVGRIARHKNQALLIKTFYYLKDRLPEGSSLTLIGSGDPVYTEYLKLLIKQLELTQYVHLKGKVSNGDLDKAYREATAFVCASLHEGFCIPLVEAMKYALPIFAIPCDGVSETLAQTGIHLYTQEPHEIAAILYKSFLNMELMQLLSRTSLERLKDLSMFQNATKLVDIVTKFTHSLSTITPHEKAGMHAGL